MVEVDGQGLHGERTFELESIAAGLVILFGKDLALWIGWMEAIETPRPIDGLVGESTAMRRLRQQIHRVADVDVPVLLRGETGSGKELVAVAIHHYSRRAKGRYVAVNVAGIPPSMAASELFGHKRGAFTGAVEHRAGYFSEADGGTLFLDEIGDVSTEVQALLLRVVQEGGDRAGRRPTAKGRCAAAGRDRFRSRTGGGRTRVSRAAVAPLFLPDHVPPLRARRDDVGLLFLHLLRSRWAEMGERDWVSAARNDDAPFVPARLIAELARQRWPGNVRELANVALKFAIDNRGQSRGHVSDDLWAMIGPRRAPADGPAVAAPPRKAAELGDAELLTVFRAERFSTERTARRLGISKGYLYKRLDRNPEVRRPGRMSADEIASALAVCSGDVDAAAARLRVSGRALRLHLKRTKPERNR